MLGRWAWAGIFALACGGEAELEQRAGQDDPLPVTVQTVVAEAMKVPDSARYLGTLLTDREARLAADATGVVTAVRVERGQTVREGDVLIEVDPRMAALQATASEAQAALARAQAQAADADCARIDTLFDGGAVAKAQQDRTRAACAAQARAVEAAESAAHMADVTLGKARVRAPFDGVIAERMVQKGEFVGPASPVVHLVSVDPMKVSFPVPERELGGLHEGGPVVVRLPALPGPAVAGTLLALPPMAREATRDVVVHARLPNADGAMKAGLSAEVEVLRGDREAVVVPPEAVLADDTLHRLFVVVDGRVVEHLVHVEPAPDGRLVVSPGISAGDVIVLGPTGLRDGVRVSAGADQGAD